MNFINLLIIILVLSQFVLVMNGSENNYCANVKTPIVELRKKRHLTFPAGTAVVMTISLVKTIVVHAPSGWNVAIEIDVIHPMLTPEMTNELFRQKLHHRQKRELWETIEKALYSYNINGRSCIYQSICDARRLLAPRGKSLVHDILKTIFSAPVHEVHFKEEIHNTYREILEPKFCEKNHDCPISMVEIMLALNKS